MKIAFYAPLKSPDHAKPSGDRQMARGLIKALEMAGHDVLVVSHFRSFSKTPHTQAQISAAKTELKSVIKKARRWGAQLWFSYHPYYKAPDFFGLEISQTLGIPLVSVEASLSAKRCKDEWADSQKHVSALLEKSSLNFYFTDRDRLGLETGFADGGQYGDQHGDQQGELVYLPPFIETTNVPEVSKKNQKQVLSFVTMGMMRGGVKSESYQFLARALKQIEYSNWRLSIIGDGSHRCDVEAYFSDFPDDQITWIGELSPDQVAAQLSTHDVFLWPGFGEAYGLAYLESQACSLPVVALKTHGVPWVVKDGQTGLLIDVQSHQAETITAYASAIDNLCLNTDLRLKLGEQARNFVLNERSLKSASILIDKHLRQIDG